MPPLREEARNKSFLREMPFLEHLEDLRGVLIHSLVAFLLTSIVCWFASERVLDFLIRDLPVGPLANPRESLAGLPDQNLDDVR